MKPLTGRLLLLVLLAFLQVAQGAFSGLALCREDSGEVAVEWAIGGQCESLGLEKSPCISKSEMENVEHCQLCEDVPFPSETSLKTLVLSPLLMEAPLPGFLRIDASVFLQAFATVTVPRSLLHEHLSSIRLLI